MTFHYGHSPHFGGHFRPFFGHSGFGFFPWFAWSGWWWGGPWWGWGWGWWPTVTVGMDYDYPQGIAPRGAWGMVKTDIQPSEAELWLDGTYVGTADDFDGYPDYLYLKPGSYKLEFRLANYQPLSADVSIASGESITLDRKLVIEEGKNALDFFPPESKGTPLGRYFGPGGKAVSGRVAIDDDAPVGIDDQRDRMPRRRSPGAIDDQGDRMPRQRSQGAAVSRDRARVRFSITPEDAAIYVDDRYVGVGEELNSSPRGIIVDAGKRTVTVSRPGFKTKTVEVESKVGQPVDVVVDLEKQ